MMASVTNAQIDSTKCLWATGERFNHTTTSPFTGKLTTYFQKRYQTEQKQIKTTVNENALDPLSRAWLLYAINQNPSAVQTGDSDIGSDQSCSSNGISTMQKRNRCPLKAIQNEAWDLSMGTVHKRHRDVNGERKMGESLNQRQKIDQQSNQMAIQKNNKKHKKSLSNQSDVKRNVTDKKSDRMECATNHTQNSRKRSPLNELSVGNKQSTDVIKTTDHTTEIYPLTLSTGVKHQKKERAFGVAHQIVPEILNCPSCDYKSSSIANFLNHAKKHRTTRQYQCKMCENLFTRSADLRTHTKIHFKTALPFKCDICGGGFLREAKKDAHERQCNPMVFGCGKCKHQTNDLSQFIAHFEIKQCLL